jgi:hypothetical protein
MVVMKRRTFISIGGATLAALGTGGYLLSDRSNLERSDLALPFNQDQILRPDEKDILFLASLAPSGHNTQPWFVQYLAPFRWVIGNDETKWLPAVDPTQRETILSIGAFVQNLEIAADSYGYACDWQLIAATNQDKRVLELKLNPKATKGSFDLEKIKGRRTVRSGYLTEELRKDDLEYLVGPDSEFVQYFPFKSKESQFINGQTLEANRLQTYRDPAQQELAEWIRFSTKDAEKYRDGLTTASMEIEGVAGWIVRNFYGKGDVIESGFRETGLDKVREQIARSAGWMIITSKDETVSSLIETGMRMQRIFLRVRDRNIAIHPMTQILEEPQTKQDFAASIGVKENVQFILRTGYLTKYPNPVSLRRPVEWFIRS